MIVEDVQPLNDGAGSQWIFLRVPSDVDIAKGNPCAWIAPEGRIPASVIELFETTPGTRSIQMMFQPGAPPRRKP